MFVLIQSSQESRGHQGFSAVYRKAQEGRVPEQERLITANVEADQQHIETIVNFACSFMWASILDTTPPQPHITLLWAELASAVIPAFNDSAMSPP